ncbi:MAG: threonine ammonia-lyase [Deltaproteobacteria bacterium]|nr:threonine ammonia-lyase [Deltaproteobacteria bacterium]
MVAFADIQAARERLGTSVRTTPCDVAEALSAHTGARVTLKLENLQVTGSFKVRGAGNKLVLLDAAEGKRGVVCASAGNHAQGVAFHAQRLGIAATIVMPVGTPLIKVSRTQALGAAVVLAGENYDDAFDEAQRIERERGAIYVHAYDDDAIIAGQGTVGLEIAEQVPDVEVLVVPVGGGGLIAGTALALKTRVPHARVVGVQVASLPSMKAALEAGHPVKLPPTRTLAEGIALRRAGERCVPLVKQYVDDIALVEDEDVARAILHLLEQQKTVAEGAGAAAVAALLAGKVSDIAGKRVVALVCGGNIDVSVLSRIIERGLVESGRLGRLEVTIPDRPGGLAEMLGEVARQRGNIVEVQHERAFARGTFGTVVVQVVVETRGHEHVQEIVLALERKGYGSARVLPT